MVWCLSKSYEGPDTKINWQTDCRSQYNLNLNLRDCTANYRPVLSSEKAHYMKKESNCHSKKCKIWSPAPNGAWHQDELAVGHNITWTCSQYSLFKSERLSAHIKLTLHRALIRSVMTYACPTWESEAKNHLLKLQRLQNKVLHTTGIFPRHTSVRDMHVAFQIPYIYGYITKLCRKQAEVIQNHENENIRYIGQGEVQHRKYKRLKLSSGHLYDCSLFRQTNCYRLRHKWQTRPLVRDKKEICWQKPLDGK
jgi:hypothetical protein